MVRIRLKNLSQYMERIKNLVNVLFFVCISLSLFSGFLYLTDVALYDNWMIVKLAYVLYLLLPYAYVFIAFLRIGILFFEKRNKAVLLLVLMVISYIHSRYSNNDMLNVFNYVAMAIAAYEVSFIRIAHVFLSGEVVFSIIIVLASVLGIVPNEIIIEGSRRFVMLGFGGHSALMMILFFNTLVLFYLLREKKVYYVELFFVGLLSGIIYYLTNSRTSFVVLMLFLCGVFIISLLNQFCAENRIRRFFSKVSLILIYMPILASIISMIGVLLWNIFIYEVEFDKPFEIQWYMLWGNTMFNRFGDASINFGMNGFRLPWENLALTKWFDAEGVKYNWLFGGKKFAYATDNVYAGIFITAGIVVFVLVMACMIYLTYRAYRTGDIIMTWVFACLSIFHIMEGLLYFVYNPFLIIIFSDWERKTETEVEGKHLKESVLIGAGL